MAITLTEIELGNVLPGAELIGEDAATNEVFRGLAQTASGAHRAYIKVLNFRGLVNELMACVLGRSLGLPILEGYLLRVRAEDIPESKILAKCPDDEQYVFGSKALEAPTMLRKLQFSWGQAERFLRENRFKRWEDIAVFDDWIANSERHPGNLLIAENKEIWCIDHCDGFTSIAWQKANLVPDIYHGNHLARHIAKELATPEKHKLIDKARELALMISTLPLSSATDVSYAAQFLSPVDDDALTTFIAERADCLADLMRKRLDFPIQTTLF